MLLKGLALTAMMITHFRELHFPMLSLFHASDLVPKAILLTMLNT
jgi:hypothetical protein